MTWMIRGNPFQIFHNGNVYIHCSWVKTKSPGYRNPKVWKINFDPCRQAACFAPMKLALEVGMNIWVSLP